MTDEPQAHQDLTPQTAADLDEATSDAGEPSEEMDEVQALRMALHHCTQELEEQKKAYVRAHADFDNFRKRLRAERDLEFGRGSDRVLNDLFPIVDDFERALSAVTDTSTVASVQQGVELIYRQLQNLLERYGLTPMTVQGQPFDPKYHDAVARVTTDAVPEHTIVGEIQRGYLKNGDVFRPAKVAVAVPPEE